MSFGVFVFVFLVGWVVSKLRKEKDNDDEEEMASEPETPTSFYLPPIDYLLEIFDYNVDENRVYGQQEKFTWPLITSVLENVSETAGELLDCVGFAPDKGTEEDEDSDKDDDEDAETETENQSKPKLGRELPYTYANLVKNLSLIFMFGLASPLVGWIGCIGLLCRWLALSFLAERFDKKRKARGEDQIKTDAQGIPFRCIVLVVICNVGFFATAALLSGISVEGEGGGIMLSFLLIISISLISYMTYLAKSDYRRVRREREEDMRGSATEPLISLA